MKTMMAAIVAVACVLPGASFAGDSEWATAGKILTGVVGLQFLQSTHKSSHRHRHYEPRSRSCESYTYRHRPQPVYRGHSHTQVIREKVIVHASNCACSTCRPATTCSISTRFYRGTVPNCNNPVVLEVNSTRRIFQPRIKGHVAYLQILDGGQWLTLREYPSVY